MLHLSLRQKELSAALSSGLGEVFVTCGWIWGVVLKWLGFVIFSWSQRTSVAHWGTCCVSYVCVDWLICYFFVGYFHSHYSNKISDAKLLMLSLDFTFCVLVTNMNWAARKRHLVRMMWIYLSTPCMQGGRAFVNWMDPAGLLASETTDKKELVFCEICFWLHGLFICLLEYDILQIYSTRHVAEPINERN